MPFHGCISTAPKVLGKGPLALALAPSPCNLSPGIGSFIYRQGIYFPQAALYLLDGPGRHALSFISVVWRFSKALILALLFGAGPGRTISRHRWRSAHEVGKIYAKITYGASSANTVSTGSTGTRSTPTDSPPRSRCVIIPLVDRSLFFLHRVWSAEGLTLTAACRCGVAPSLPLPLSGRRPGSSVTWALRRSTC